MNMNNKKIYIDEVANIFSKKNVYSSYLFIEKELATAQGELKMIPKSSAIEISKKCNIKYFNLELFEKDLQKSKAPIVSLVRSIVNACNEEAKKFVHYGATTHNILHAGTTLLFRKAHVQAMFRMSECLETLSLLSKKYSNLPMVARSNGQHAMPITFGFKLAEWTEELLRFEQRFEELEKRLFILIFGGAVGAMHSFRNKGDLLYKKLAKKLNLNTVYVPSRAIYDNTAEYALLCGHLGSALLNIGRELEFYMREEVQAISEKLAKGVVGSSTMPQKINPKYVYAFIAAANDMACYTVRGNAVMSISNEGDHATHVFARQTIHEMLPKLNVLLEDFNGLLNTIQVHPEKMIQTLELTQGLINAENVVMEVAPIIGKQKAYKALHDAIDHVRYKKMSFEDALLLDKDISSNLSAKDIRNLVDPKKNTGNSVAVAIRVSKLAQIRSAKLKKRLQKIKTVF